MDRRGAGSLQAPEATVHHSTAHPDPARQFVVEVDVSETGVVTVLSQRASMDDKVHLCSFSRQLSPAEQNYDVGNRELLAVVLALQE